MNPSPLFSFCRCEELIKVYNYPDGTNNLLPNLRSALVITIETSILYPGFSFLSYSQFSARKCLFSGEDKARKMLGFFKAGEMYLQGRFGQQTFTGSPALHIVFSDRNWYFVAMKCFSFSSGDKSDGPKTIKSSVRSSSTSVSADPEAKKSGSEFNSLDGSDISVEFSGRKSFASLSQKPSTLRVYAVSELKTATKNFSRSLMLGEGGFGGVYRGVVPDAEHSKKKIDIAVKQLSRRGLQGHKEWVTEVNVLGIVEHQNLVKLIGYSAEDDERGIERLLVYEYMPNRSVLDHLSSRCRTPLPWATRLKIAQDAACGLAYLHEGMDFQIIFRDFKSSNILLDEQWNAKLSDFGLARLGPSDGLSHVSTAVVGTVGYAAPEYIQTGRLTAKSDVWSYGIFLYELITGRRPLDMNRPKNEQKLLDWARPHLTDMKKFQLILDPRLNGKYSIKSAQRLAAIANRCLVRKPKLRPKMSEVLEMLNLVMDATETENCQVDVEKFKHKDSNKKSFKEGMKRRFVDSIVGENRSLVWRTWRPKLVRTI